MPHPLDGARLKLNRATEHLKEIKVGVLAYVDTKPHETILEIKGNKTTFTQGSLIAPGGKFSLVAGDCLTNIRAALDYVMWELASAYSGRMLDPDRDRPHFPIYRVDDNGFRDWLAEIQRKYTISTEALDALREVQPFNPGFEPLMTLRTLVNRDKHRLLLLTGCFAQTLLAFTAGKIPDGTYLIKVGGVDASDVTIYEGDRVVPSDAKSYGKLSIVLRDLGSRTTPIEDTLGRIIASAELAIGRFDPFF